MNTIAFDTHAAASRFKRAGFTEDQIEALVDIARATTALPDVSTLATKSDLAQLEAKMDSRFGVLESTMDARFGALESTMDARFGVLETTMDARFGALETTMDARFGVLETTMDARFQQSGARTEAGEARLEAAIANAQVQAVTIILSGTAIIVTLATLLSKLIH